MAANILAGTTSAVINRVDGLAVSITHTGSEAELRARGLIRHDDALPRYPHGCCRGAGMKITMRRDGRLRVRLDPDVSAARDVTLQRVLANAARRQWRKT